MIRILIPFLFAGLSTASVLSEVTSYTKVSRNGQEEKEMKNSPSSWIARTFSQRNGTENEENEGRGLKDIVITVSPVYVAPKTPKLQNGEAVDYPPTGRYSTLDHELIAKLDAAKKKQIQQIQDRYHPSPIITKNNGQSNGMRQQNSATPTIRPSGPSSSDSFDFPKPSYADTFDYKPPSYFSDKPISKPMTSDDYPNSEISDKPPDSYKPDSDSFYSSHDHDTDFSDFPPYGSDVEPKPIEFSGHHHHPPYEDDPYDHDHEYHHHEVIYDHIPEYHDHPHDQTEEPEMNDQRLDKRPYSYYFIGKKLWYVPLYFSIYFIIYIAALVLKSIARHKISFPAHLAEAVGHGRKNTESSWWDLTGRVLEGIENFAEKFGRVS